MKEVTRKAQLSLKIPPGGTRICGEAGKKGGHVSVAFFHCRVHRCLPLKPHGLIKGTLFPAGQEDLHRLELAREASGPEGCGPPVVGHGAVSFRILGEQGDHVQIPGGDSQMQRGRLPGDGGVDLGAWAVQEKLNQGHNFHVYRLHQEVRVIEHRRVLGYQKGLELLE